MIRLNSFQHHPRHFLPHLTVVVLLLAGIPTVEYFHRLVAERTEQLHRTEALGLLSQLRSQVETEINSVLFLTRGLVAYVAVNARSTPAQWRALAAEIIRSSPHIRSIGLAPDNVLSFIYPLKGNEKAVGLDYRESPEQWPSVERAISIGGTVMAGPLELVQGGRGLIARTPIYSRSDPVAPPVYWGLSSVVIDADSLFSEAGIQEKVGGYQIAIIGRDGLGADGEMIQGTREVMEQSIAQLKVVFPNGHWILAAQPEGDLFWDGHQLVRLVGYGFITMLGVLLVVLIRLYHNSRGEALHDSLTGLANRRLLMERLTQMAVLQQRTGIGFALYFIDLNNFKPINDRYGHSAGDAALKEVGHRLQSAVRTTDTVARTGGDEFMVLLPAVASDEAAQQVSEKLEQVLRTPFIYQLQPLMLSAAIGYALYPQDSDQVDNLVMLADERMFEHKEKSKTDAQEGEQVPLSQSRTE